LTPPLEHLARRRKRYPLSRPDRAAQLYDAIRGGLPHPLRDLLTSGNLAIGEIGRHRPDVFTLPVTGGFAVEFTTGMMDFIYAVSRALTGAVTGWGRSGLEYKAAKELSGVTPHVANTFRQWGEKWGARGWLPWNWGRIKVPDFWIAEGAWQQGEELATVAEAFILSHELGHVALNIGLFSSPRTNAELAADEFGLAVVLTNQRQLRFPFAAAVFAVRIFAGLERFGVRFSDAYPRQAERITALNNTLSSMSPSRQCFHEVSTIAVAYQNMLDEVERILSGESSPVLLDEERALVTMIAMLEEVTRGRLPEENFLKDFIYTADKIPESALTSVTSSLLHYYTTVPPGPAYLPYALRVQMGERLLSSIPKFPANLKNAFQQSDDRGQERFPQSETPDDGDRKL